MKTLEKVLSAGTLSLAAVMGGCTFEAPENETADVVCKQGAVIKRPAIKYISIPARQNINASTTYLFGKVENVDYRKCKVATFIRVEGEWWPKPFFNNRFSEINPDGVFGASVITGGHDFKADSYYSALVTKNYRENTALAGIPESRLPDPSKDESVLAVVRYDREDMEDE